MRRPRDQVREQMFVDAPARAVLAVLSTRDRSWLRVLAQLAVGEAGRDEPLNPTIVLGAASTDGDEWTWGVRLGSFRGSLVARRDGAGVRLSASGVAPTTDRRRTRSSSPAEDAVRSLLGLLRNVIEERARRE